MSHRPLVALAAAALTAGSSLVALAPPAGAASPPWCRNADLHATYRGGGGAAGTFFGRIVLTNTSHHACRTGGYGGISYVGHGNGTQIGAPADRDPGAHPVITLHPGQRVFSEIGEATALNFPANTCHPTHVDGFRVYVPNSTKSQFIAHPTTGCANPAVHTLRHKAYRRP